MNEPEERLWDALKDVGETIRPGDVPPPPFPDRSPPSSAFARPLVMGTLIAAFALVMGGLAVGGHLVVDRTSGDRSGQNAAAASSERRVSVFLCTRSASAQHCRRADATEQQKADIKRRLEAMPRVRRVEYESREQAYANFKKRFAKDEEFLKGIRPGDVPDSYRVRVADAEAAKAVKAAMVGVPGVDAVVIDPLKPRA